MNHIAQDLRMAEKSVGPGQPCFVIAEIAQAHDGSLGMAHSFIDAAADARVDAIKFQTHIAAEESTRDEPWRVKFSKQDESRYEYWQRMEFTAEQWAGLARHAAERGLVFLSSAFSIAAVELLQKLEMPAWKIASGETTTGPLLDAMLATGKPMLVSTGMSPWPEIEAMADAVRRAGNPLAFFQCTSKYPTSPGDVGLNVIEELRTRFGVPVGLSDHSGTPFPGLAAMARGADLLEVHAIFDRRMFGPDSKVSLTFDELAMVCRARDAFHAMDSSPVDKDRMAEQLSGMRAIFTKSVALHADQPAGTVLTREMLTTKKPGTGIPAARMAEVVGRRLKRDVRADGLLDPVALE